MPPRHGSASSQTIRLKAAPPLKAASNSTSKDRPKTALPAAHAYTAVTQDSEISVYQLQLALFKNLSRALDIFRGLDVNQDGNITRNEFYQVCPAPRSTVSE